MFDMARRTVCLNRFLGTDQLRKRVGFLRQLGQLLARQIMRALQVCVGQVLCMALEAQIILDSKIGHIGM